MIVLGITLLLLFLFYVLNFFLRIKDLSYNKIGAFERGFVSVGKIQNSFRIHFFIIILMFVIFDLEIVMLLGVLVSDFNSFLGFIMLFFFILGGFYIE